MRRSYHDSPYTATALSVLPDWMKLKDKNSLGYHFINALVSQEVDRAVMLLGEYDDTLGLDSPEEKAIENVYYNKYVTLSNTIPQDIVIDAYLSTGLVHLIPYGTISVAPTGVSPIVVEKLEYFVKGAPTRLTYDSAQDIEPDYITGDITGISYVKNFKVLDEDGLETIEKQDVVIVNQKKYSPCEEGEMSTIVYDREWNVISSYDYGLEYQDYQHTGSYEIITDTSGYTLEYNPIISSVIVYDYINVDPSGNAQVIPSGNYTVSQSVTDYALTTEIVMDGINPYNSDSIEKSNYFVTYQYIKYDYPRNLTTQKSKFGVQVSASPPMFTSTPSNYYGTKVPIEPSESYRAAGAAFRIDPTIIRPGNSLSVKFNYIGVSDIAWGATSTFTHDMSDDTYYVGADSNAVRVIGDKIDLTQHYTPTVSGNSVNIYHSPVPLLSISPPYTVRVYYSAQKDYGSVGTVQSFSDLVGVADPYPQDYMLDGDALIPYTILPITDSNDVLSLALYNAGVDNFEVTSNLLFNGIAYDGDKDCYWMIESNNMILYKVSPGDGTVIGRWNIFKRPNIPLPSYKTIASGVIDRYNGTTRNYNFISHSKDDPTRIVNGMVYYKDFLYILSLGTGLSIDGVTVGGDGIWRLDTYNDRIMDIEYGSNKLEVYPHFPLDEGTLPSGICGGSDPTDITIDIDGNFLVAGGSTVSKLALHYDYVIIDSDGSTSGTIYYREQYDTVTIDGYDEVV